MTLIVATPFFAVAQDDNEEKPTPIQLAQYPGAPYEDRHGNLWFGTVLEGLIRYDGNEFVTFTEEDGLGSNMIRGIVEDEEGVLWIATSGGLTKYDGETFTTLTNYEPITVTQGWSEHGNHRELWDVMIDSHGKLWIATMDGIFQYDGEIFTRFEMPVVAVDRKWLFTPRKVSCVFEDQGGDLWFGTDGAGAVRWDGKTMVVYTVKTHGLSSDNVSSIFQDSRGDYWFGTANGGVSHYDGNTFTTHLRSKEFSKHSGWGRYFAIHEDRQGYVWFGAAYEGGGAYRYDGESFEYFSGNPGLGAGGVPSIREDRSGNLWFGTTGGVYHFDGQRFTNFTKNNPQLPTPTNDVDTTASVHDTDPVSLVSPEAEGPPDAAILYTQPELTREPAQIKEPEQISEYVREVFQDRDGVYWFGTNGDGIARYNGKSLTYISFNNGLVGTAIRGILQSPDGALWFATNRGVSRYEEGAFTNYTTADGLSDNNIWSIMQDSSGTIWVGTHAGVCRFDGEVFVTFPLDRVEVENPESRFSPLVVFAMFEDLAGNIWFGTDGEGVHKYDGDSFTSYTTKDGLAGNVVRAITGDRAGRIWIGTNGGGASRFDGRTFENFTSKDGLNNDRIYEILEDSAGNIWFSTLGKGASRYDGTTFTAFREDQTLMINGHPARGHVQEFFEDKDGILWLGCSGGLFYFDSESESFINVTRDGPWPSTTKKHAHDPISLEDWASETILLPPGFAPEMPTGKEMLLFAPGWRDSDADEFWSYAFVMWIDEPAPDAARIDELLESYYDGLMSALGIEEEIEKDNGPAQVEVVRTGSNKFEATIRLIDGFTTLKPLDLHAMIETDNESENRTILRVKVSPQPKEHKIWRSLNSAIEAIESTDN